MPASPKPIEEVLRSIEQGSIRVNILATELSKRITSFEAWLNGLPGKIEATIWHSEVDDEEECVWHCGLHFHRSGGKWIVSHDETDDPSSPPSWKPLAEASVDTKLAALRRFPRLLEAISQSQKSRIDQLESAHEEFDAFSRAIGAAGKKGG